MILSPITSNLLQDVECGEFSTEDEIKFQSNKEDSTIWNAFQLNI